MVNKLILFSILLFSAACGRFETKSQLKKILSKGSPNWSIVTDTNKHEYSSNIFALSYRGQIRGTGFVVSGKRNVLFTNAHVALPWREMCKIKCPKLIGMNRDNVVEITGFHKTKDFNGIDLDLDFAILEFKWLEKSAEVKEMVVSDKLPVIEDGIQVVGFTFYESDFVISKGIVRGENFSANRKPSFHYDADTDNLNSGSPVFDSNNVLVGIHFGIPKGSEFNRAIPIHLLMSKYPYFFMQN